MRGGVNGGGDVAGRAKVKAASGISGEQPHERAPACLYLGKGRNFLLPL